MKKTCHYFLTLIALLAGKAFAQAPVASPISGPANVCWAPSSSVTFSLSATNSPTLYAWSISPNVGVVTVNLGSTEAISFSNLNATYTVYCTASNASGSSATQSFVVNIFQKPTVTFSGNTFICQGSATGLSASPTVIQASSTLNNASTTLYYTWSPPTGLNTTVGPNVTAFPSVTTTYTVSVLNGVCTSTAPITVYVMQSPTITVNSGSVCAGQPFVLQASGTIFYSYSSGSVVYPTVATVYTVSGYDYNYCWSAPVTATVGINPPPSISVNSAPICAGETAQLTAFGATNYTWSTGDQSSGISVSPPANSDYTVTGTDANGCTATVVTTQVVDACLGIANVNAALQQVKVFPNPASTALTIDPGATGEEITVQLSNAMGQLLVEEKISTVHTFNNLGSLPAGIYFITLKQKDVVKTLKIIKE